jgi:predicted transcriptional regulator
MALEGNLTSFKIEEILQLIAVQQKTGMLSVVANDKSAVLFFRDGKIVSTRDRRSKTRDPFREYLTRYGCLGREDLTRITQIIAQSKLDLLDILHSEGFFDEKQLGRHWRNHIQETLHDVLTWDQCTYKFVSGEDIVGGVKSLGEYSVEPLLMESMRRIDEFPALLQAFPAQGIRISATGKEYKGEEPITESEKLVLSLLKTARAMRDVIQRANMPTYDAYESLKMLKEKGLIVVQEDARDGAIGETHLGSRAIRRKRGNPMLLVAASFVFFACVVVGVWQKTDNVALVARDGVLRADGATRARVEQRMRWLLETYRAEYGTYPESLDDLAKSGIAAGNITARAATHRFEYRLTRDGSAYTLL